MTLRSASVSGSGGGLAGRLAHFAPAGPAGRWPAARRPANILHLLSQQPGQTGSGVALLALVRLAADAGFRQRAVIGLPATDPAPAIPPLDPRDVVAVRFERPPVPFPIAGMSDVMPYASTRFSDFTPQMLAGYLEAFSAALATAVAGFEPDIIQSNHLWLLTALARVLFPRTPLCVYSHGTELRQLETAAGLARFVLPACSDVDRVFALHDDNRERIMQAYRIPAERVRVVGAGFRDDLFHPDPACTAAESRAEIVIAYAGKISPPKGVPWLIDAFLRLKAPESKRLTLLLAGSSGDAAAEGIRSRAAGSDRIVFLGALPQEELATVLQKADVFVLPSFFEGLPLVVIESLACGCRVVMTDLPGVDAWMPAGLCAEGHVERVPLPRLAGPDTPVSDDLPRFVAELAAALERQVLRSLECGRMPQAACRLAPLTWSGVFKRIEAAWSELDRV
jgi:glycosyltransferase involved in cell wall biosynthesis